MCKTSGFHTDGRVYNVSTWPWDRCGWTSPTRRMRRIRFRMGPRPRISCENTDPEKQVNISKSNRHQKARWTVRLFEVIPSSLPVQTGRRVSSLLRIQSRSYTHCPLPNTTCCLVRPYPPYNRLLSDTPLNCIWAATLWVKHTTEVVDEIQVCLRKINSWNSKNTVGFPMSLQKIKFARDHSGDGQRF